MCRNPVHYISIVHFSHFPKQRHENPWSLSNSVVTLPLNYVFGSLAE